MAISCRWPVVAQQQIVPWAVTVALCCSALVKSLWAVTAASLCSGSGSGSAATPIHSSRLVVMNTHMDCWIATTPRLCASRDSDVRTNTTDTNNKPTAATTPVTRRGGCCKRLLPAPQPRCHTRYDTVLAASDITA